MAKKNEFMSMIHTWREKVSLISIHYTVIKLKTLKLIIALSSFKYVMIQDGCHIHHIHSIFTQKNNMSDGNSRSYFYSQLDLKKKVWNDNPP